MGRIPISGHHLDELDNKDRLMVLINAIQTVPFTYHVACYVLYGGALALYVAYAPGARSAPNVPT